MEEFVEHIKANQTGYIAIVVCVVPILVIFKKYTAHVLLYIAEAAMYLALMHAAIGLLVRVAAWFKTSSSFDGEKIDWKTPWLEVWDKTQYDPQWIAYFEIGACAVILFLMFKIKPLRTQKYVSMRKEAPKPQKKVKSGPSHSISKGSVSKSGIRKK